MESDSQPFTFLRKLGDPMSSLFADPLSELTRKQQKAVLIVASIALLLSFGLANVGQDVSHAGLKVILQVNARTAALLAAAVTAYLAGVFWLAARADRAAARCKQWSPLASVREVKAAMQARRDARARAAREREELVAAAKAELDDVRKKHTQYMTELDAREHKIDEALASPHDHVQGEALLEKMKEIHAARAAALKDSKFDAALKRLRELGNAALDSAIDQFNLRSEGAELDEYIQTFRTLTLRRLKLEVFFPTVYATLAVLSGILGALGFLPSLGR